MFKKIALSLCFVMASVYVFFVQHYKRPNTYPYVSTPTPTPKGSISGTVTAKNPANQLSVQKFL